MSNNSFRTTSAVCPRQVHLAVELSCTHQGVQLTVPSGADPDTVRIKATDLRAAQRSTARIRADAIRDGRDPSEVVVLVDLEAMIADDAGAARAEMNDRGTLTDGPAPPDSLRYVGTPAGLAGLIGDIVTADVANGVTLRPLSPTAWKHFVEATLPRLRHLGFAVDSAPQHFLPACQREQHQSSPPTPAAR